MQTQMTYEERKKFIMQSNLVQYVRLNLHYLPAFHNTEWVTTFVTDIIDKLQKMGYKYKFSQGQIEKLHLLSQDININKEILNGEPLKYSDITVEN